MKILKYGHSALLKPSVDVVDFDRKTHALVQGMSFLLDQDPNAAAVAANQVGSNLNLFVWKEEQPFDYPIHHVIINPLIKYGENLVSDIEGCLSFPQSYALIKRFHSIQVSYVSFPDLKECTVNLEGFPARVFQHEIEHLSGKVFIDNLNEVDRAEFLKRMLSVKNG